VTRAERFAVMVARFKERRVTIKAQKKARAVQKYRSIEGMLSDEPADFAALTVLSTGKN
jgi:hypothetical protein